MIKKYIPRPIYINRVKPYINKELIKVLIGQRRSGKSYILYQIIDILIKEYHVAKEDIIYINKELHEFGSIKNYKDLLHYVKNSMDSQVEHENDNRKKYIVIDEVQDIEAFEKALRDLQVQGNFDIYISGSNANILSSELSTFLSGRYIEIEVFPLSYLEFLEFHKKKSNKESFLEYIKYGGLPYLIHLELTDEVVYDYLKNVYNSILLKDIVQRYSVRNVSFLENLVSFLANNTGSIVSAKKISDFLKKERVNISPNVILNYLSFLSSVFFVFTVKRQEIGKKIFEIGSKHYFGDLGLRHSVQPYTQTDIGKVLENIVYLHLRICGYKVYVGQIKNKEIDFVAEKQGEKKYIQVCYLMINEKTKDREFGNLLSIQDNYEKIVVSMDEMIEGDFKGIKHMNVIEFLSHSL
jgi:uncharacterized protein